MNTLERLYEEAKQLGEADLFIEMVLSGVMIVLGMNQEEFDAFIEKVRTENPDAAIFQGNPKHSKTGRLH